MSLGMVFGHGFVSTTQQTSSFVFFRAISALRECLRGRAMSVTNPDQVCSESLNSFCEYNLSEAVPGSPDPLPPVPSHHAAQRITLCGENATDQGG